ncbi:flavin-dependent oxidoreductase [Chitinophaga skermanii]|uniref:Flavin-dependent oxidoreductase n=1 Tax=Chitinophaga skermanii TaxID=331697 RepID=A0A327QXH8_9BACT|nr:FAD-binding oxidoreductase [Chitinophaga skermanii]RAJ08665.1 flavin-dependent oxidoreductase [Chitinophaga skermanii]
MPKIAKWLGDTIETLMSSKFPLMQVLETTFITPTIKKIRLQGATGDMNFQPGYAVIIRVSSTEYRNYTASFSESKDGIIDIIAHIHGDYPGSNFMAQLQVNDEIRISMPRGKTVYNPHVSKQFLFGDETSLGLAASLQPLFKKHHHQYQFYFELDPGNMAAPRLAGLDHYTVFSKSQLFHDEQWVATLPIFQETNWEDYNFIMAGNAKSIQTLRKVLRQNKARGSFLAQAYWAAGKVGL